VRAGSRSRCPGWRYSAAAERSDAWGTAGARDGTNRIVGTLAVASVPDWTRLHAGLARVSAELTLPDLSRFQEWVPRIRRFSYTLSSAAKNELAHQRR